MKYFLILLFLYNILQIKNFKCSHNIIKKPPLKIINETLISKERKLSSLHSISIFIDYEILESQLEKGEIDKYYFSNISLALNLTISYFSKLLTLNSSFILKLSSNLLR